MKKILLVFLLLLACGAVYAQNPGFTVVTIAPTVCNNSNQVWLLVPTGVIYTCVNGTPTAQSGGGAGTCGALGGDVTGTCAADIVTAIQSQAVNGVTGTSNVVFSASPALTGTPSTPTPATGDASTTVANMAALSNALQAINPAVAVQAGTTGALSNTPTYNNGTAGVGATLTAGSSGALTIDGYSPVLNDRVLIKNQATTLQNGVYTLTTLGDSMTAYVLTRATDYNSTTNINYTGTIPVLQGSTNANTGWNLNTQIAAVGTSALTYTQAAAGSSGGPPGGNVKATGNLSVGDVITGAGGKTIQDAGVAVSSLASLSQTNTFTGRQNATGAASTGPLKTGTSVPATCTVGDLFFKSDATAGQNIYQCQSTNVYTQQLNSAPGGGGITMYSGTGLTVTANTYYIPVGGGGTPSTTEANVDIDSPASATITNLYVQLSVALGMGNSGVFTFRKNGASQSVTCTISGASATSCNDTAHSFGVSQGDLLTIQLVTTGTIVVTPNVLIAAQFGNITQTGTVNSGTATHCAYYAGTGTAVSDSGAVCPTSGTVTQTIGSGTIALTTSAISSATCSTASTVTVTGTATTDTVIATFNADPSSTTGYLPSTSGSLYVYIYPTTNTVNAKVCNNTTASITPGAATINVRVVR